MTFDLQTILVQDQTFHLFNHAQKVTQLLALEYVHLTISFVLYEDPYKKHKGYMPMIGHIAQTRQIVATNFRTGRNRGIGEGQLEIVQ
jgi:hypothetical protein